MIVLNCDITVLKVDIIVNAANKSLLGGGGVDGLIHRKAGMKLREECVKLNGCEEGNAKMTGAYNLICDKIVHTVGPVYRDGNQNEEKALKNCYVICMELAESYRKKNNLDSVTIAFPCIGTGAFGYPKEEASRIAVDTIKEINNEKVKVVFCCYEVTDYQIYVKNVYGININYLD